MNEKIKFSVLIPVYNVEKFIEECMNSVLNQTYQEFEIVLIDDGSTDNSGLICQKYAENDKRIKVYHQTNQGLLMARRNAILKATGDYFLFLDSDDYWDFDLLESIYNTICEYNSDLVIFKYKKVSEEGTFISEPNKIFTNNTIIEHHNKGEIIKKIISSSDLNNLVCKAVKRSIIDNTDYYQYKKIKNAEDLLQSLPLIYNARKIIYINKAMYNYRISTNSITQTLNLNFIKDITTVRGIVLQYMRKFEVDDEVNLSVFYQFYIISVINYIFDIANSTILKKEKMQIFLQAKNLQLYIDASNNIEINKLSLREKITFYLFDKSHYKVLFVYVKIMACISKIIKRRFLIIKGLHNHA